ncbi:MAG: hypothetical protein J7L55_02375 [Desulfurococcales archaeon]|nr:hypothetical protein [Desulfurococcales archaeon]
MKEGSRVRDRREDLRRLFSRVVDTLSRAGKKYAPLKFPTSYRERSIDLIAVGKDGKNAVLRIKSGSRITKEEAEDLRKASLALDSIPIAVSDDPSLYDNIIYEKEGVYLMNERTLDNLYNKPNEIIALYRKGDLYLVVNRDAIKRERARKEMSLGDASYALNLSRKMIYTYEKEGGMVTIETAEKLVNLFGTDAVMSVNHEMIREDFMNKARRKVEADATDVIKEIVEGGEAYKLRKSAPDYIVKGEDVETVIDATSKEFSLRKVVKKVTECVKLSEFAWSNVHLLVTPSRVEVVRDELSTQVSLNKIRLHKIRKSSEG